MQRSFHFYDFYSHAEQLSFFMTFIPKYIAKRWSFTFFHTLAILDTISNTNNPPLGKDESCPSAVQGLLKPGKQRRKYSRPLKVSCINHCLPSLSYNFQCLPLSLVFLDPKMLSGGHATSHQRAQEQLPWHPSPSVKKERLPNADCSFIIKINY